MRVLGFASAASLWPRTLTRSLGGHLSLRLPGHTVGRGPGRRRGYVMETPLPNAPDVEQSNLDRNKKFDMDHQFARLNHVNKNLRKKAAAAIAENVNEETVPRLVSLLEIEDTGRRRAAVQTLGMIGVEALGPLCHQLLNNGNRTVRASCSKAMAAIAMYHPHERENFPPEALNALEHALKEDPDPVTKLATVGCLGTLGSGLEQQNIKPNSRAIDFLLELLESTSDMAIAATTIGALGQIGFCGQKEKVLNALKAVASRQDDDESGVSVIKNMAAAHVTQLESGSASPVLTE